MAPSGSPPYINDLVAKLDELVAATKKPKRDTWQIWVQFAAVLATLAIAGTVYFQTQHNYDEAFKQTQTNTNAAYLQAQQNAGDAYRQAQNNAAREDQAARYSSIS